MTDRAAELANLTAKIITAPKSGRRRMVALAGPPASGKSTLAAALVEGLTAQGLTAQLVPMDGFHLDNSILRARGQLARKGAPETFDAAGFVHLVRRIREQQEEVIFPVFDRSRDIAIAGAGAVQRDCDTVIVEGNYLLFDEAPWRALAPLWDVSIQIDPPIDVLRARLVERWTTHGLNAQEALARAEENDLVNAKRLGNAMLPADITLS